MKPTKSYPARPSGKPPAAPLRAPEALSPIPEAPESPATTPVVAPQPSIEAPEVQMEPEKLPEAAKPPEKAFEVLTLDTLADFRDALNRAEVWQLHSWQFIPGRGYVVVLRRWSGQ